MTKVKETLLENDYIVEDDIDCDKSLGEFELTISRIIGFDTNHFKNLSKQEIDHNDAILLAHIEKYVNFEEYLEEIKCDKNFEFDMTNKFEKIISEFVLRQMHSTWTKETKEGAIISIENNIEFFKEKVKDNWPNSYKELTKW